MATTWMPSKSWNAAASRNNWIEVAITAGSLVRRPAIGREKTRSVNPDAVMNEAPMTSAVQPDVAAPRPSPRPIAWPTRIAPAEATPSGTMNVRLDAVRTIWCAARLTASSRPASAVAVAKTVTSRPSCSAAGQPSPSSRPNRAGSNRGQAANAFARGPRPQIAKLPRATVSR